jgi:hypothetical protein
MCIHRRFIRAYGTISFVKINSLIKKSLHVEFYKDLIREFESNDKFINLISNIEDQNSSFNLKDFKGVMVIRDKNNNVYETSSHGNFSRNKNKQVNTTFKSWNPTKRWTPTTINVQEKIVGVGFENKLFIQHRYGINIDKLTPKGRVKKLLIEKNKKLEVKDSKKRTYIKNTIKVTDVHNLMQSKKDIYQKILPLNDLIIDGFLIDENHSYTPVFLKEVLKDHFKKSIGSLKWVGK